MRAFPTYTGSVILVLAVGACGIKAPPIPRETVVPAPIEDIRSTVTDKGITLEWMLPGRSLDGSPLRELAGYKVIRDGPDGKKVRTEIWFPISERKKEIGEKALFSDSVPSQKGVYTFWVVPFDAYGTSAPPREGAAVNWEGAR